MKDTILITGGLGFIGSNVIIHLLKTTPYSILIFDKTGNTSNLPNISDIKKRVHIMQGDILKKRSIQQAVRESSIIIHMAAATHAGKSISQSLSTITTNVIGTTMLLEAAEKYPVERIIIYSSSEVYGNQLSGIPMDESHPLNPVSPYAASKVATDRIGYAFHLSKHLPVTVVRPFNAYGPLQHPEKMIPLFITRLLRDKPISLNHGGKQKRDWVFIEDHARAIEAIIKAPSEKVLGNVFNIGTGKSTSVAEVARLILKALKKSEKKYLQIAQSGVAETSGNVGISKHLERTLEWKAKTSLEEGIDKTVKWYKKNESWWGKFI